MDLRSTQRDENEVEEGLIGNYTYLCHLDRSAAEWRDLWFVCVTADPGHSAFVSLRCGKPQISPLRFAPVEMTKIGVIANQAFLNLIFIPLGGPQVHEHSLENHHGKRALPAVVVSHPCLRKDGAP